jgi:hypothetical protein
MNSIVTPILACGPGPGFAALVLIIYGGGLAVLVSFIAGLILMIAGRTRLGLAFLSFSVLVVATVLTLFRTA